MAQDKVSDSSQVQEYFLASILAKQVKVKAFRRDKPPRKDLTNRSSFDWLGVLGQTSKASSEWELSSEIVPLVESVSGCQS